ncbi:hypothetical protein EV126DRAFT_335990 [Verticillium dahliae]|nr:hypothetical protein EV126DRAFT_335990 [Verticillium dahliae]
MASTSDLQQLLRALSSKNATMAMAMGQARLLQNAGLKSIQEIADAPFAVVREALGNQKTAKSVQSICRKHSDDAVSGGTNKRSLEGPVTPAAKKSRIGPFAIDGDGEARSPAEVEQSLAIPIITQEDQLRTTVIYINRAPVLLAFTLELLRVTMPEQPLSSRLSLAQAVMSSNARVKAVDIGLEQDIKAKSGTWQLGQPTVRIMGREISILKRGDYPLETIAGPSFGSTSIACPEQVATIHGQVATVQEDESASEGVWSETNQQANPHNKGLTTSSLGNTARKEASGWSTSQRIDMRGSSFIAHSTPFTASDVAKSVIGAFIDSQPILKTASHNFWGYRIQRPETFTSFEGADDDGETGGGQFILRLLREADTVDRLVVVSRWFGGVMLGPDRWGLIRRCVNEALAEGLRLHNPVDLHQEVAVWALDTSPQYSMRNQGTHSARPSSEHGKLGFVVHEPEAARNYLLSSFAAASDQPTSVAMTSGSPKRRARQSKTSSFTVTQAEENAARVLGSFRLLFESWARHLTPRQLDQRAWAWYVAIRPNVESGPQGWGAKGTLSLVNILALRWAAPGNNQQ